MKKISLSMKMLIATILGIVVGVGVQMAGLSEVATTWIAPIGTLFLNFMKMIIIPLIFCMLVTGIYQINDIRKYGQVGIKTILSFFIMTALAAAIGLGVASIFNVGSGVQYQATGAAEVPEAVNIIDTVINFVPSNIFEAFTNGDMVAIVIFGVIFGIGMLSTQKTSEPIYNFIISIQRVIEKITGWMMQFAPIGIFAIVAETMANNGVAMLVSMMTLVLVTYLGFIINNILVYGSAAAISGVGIGEFYKKTFEPFVFAFTSQTSSAAIPFINKAMDKLGVSKVVESFVIPLGSAMHKNGTALYQCVFTIFLANYYQIEINPATFLAIIFAATLSSMGTAGVPQGGMVTLGMVLATAGVPLEGVSIVAGLISIIGMGSTVNNVGGDIATALLINGTKKREVEETIGEAEFNLR